MKNKSSPEGDLFATPKKRKDFMAARFSSPQSSNPSDRSIDEQSNASKFDLLDSADIDESYRVRQEAIGLGLVPTESDEERRIYAARRLKQLLISVYILLCILMFFVIWICIYAALLPTAKEVLRYASRNAYRRR